MSITKAVLTVTSSFAPASAIVSGISLQSWGCITLWDITPWLPWNSRGLVGTGNWQDYLSRLGVMDSTQAPGYSPISQSPKGWAKQTKTVTIIDTSTSGGTAPFAQCAVVGNPPYTGWIGNDPDPATESTVAFDMTTITSLVSSLVIAAYAYNSAGPFFGGPTGTDNLNIYDVYLDVTVSGGGTTRFRPQTSTVVAPGPGVGSPTTAINTGQAVDQDATTFATVEETNGNNGGFGALWHPAVLLLSGWSWGSIACGDPPDGIVGNPYSHTFPVTGGSGTLSYAITVGSLPDGLVLDPATGTVSGVPTVEGTFTFTITATDATGITASVSCSIQILPLSNPHYILDLWIWRLLRTFTNVNQALAFPPGYERGLRLALAVELGRVFGRDTSKIRKQLAPVLAAIDRENVSDSQAVEELPEQQ